MIQLYGNVNTKSYNTLKIRFALAEIGAAYEFVPVDLAKGESRKPEFLRINPHGKIPVLRDADFALPESDAILWYLGEKFPEAKLLPPLSGDSATLQARAQILRFLGIASTAIYPAYSEWWNASNSDDPAKRNPAAADAALAKVTRALSVLEKTLASGDQARGEPASSARRGPTREGSGTLPGFPTHLVGAFSLADVSNASIIFSLKRRLPTDPLSGHERVRAWYDRLIARPAWKSVVADN